MMNFLPLVVVALGVGAAIYFLFFHKKSSGSTPPATSPNNPWTIGPLVNGQDMSAGMPAQPTANSDGSFSFTFPTVKPGVHGMTRPVTEAGRAKMQAVYDIAIGADGKFLEVDGDPADPVAGAVRLFLQRKGDDWDGPNTGKSSYRFYSAPMPLVPGPSALSAALTPDLWTNVDGQQDAPGFAAMLADLGTVGLAFGGRFAMHGVYADGPATFTLRSFVLSA